MAQENTEPARPFSRHYPVAMGQADPAGRMRVSALAEYLMDCADHHARQLNCDIATLRAHGVTWMVTGFSVTLLAPIACGDALTITTWPKAAPSTIIYFRDFSVENARGEAVALASSAWVLLDKASLRMLRGSQVKLLARLIPRGEQALPVPQRVRPPKAEVLSVQQRRSYYADLDLNGHVTTRRYFEWVEDALEEDLLSGKRVAGLTMDFARQILPGRDVSVSRLAGGGADWVRIESAGALCLAAKVLLEEPKSGLTGPGRIR